MISQRRAGVILGYTNIIVKNVVNLLYTPMLLAFVGQAEYGVYQTSYQFVFSLQLLSFGLSGAYVRFYAQRATRGDEDGIRSLNGMYLLLYMAICAVAIVLGLIFSGFCGIIFSGSFSANEISLATILMAVMTFNVATTLLSTVFDANIIAHERFSFQQTRQLFTTLATPGFALVLLWFGTGALGVAIAQLLVNIVLLILNARYAMAQLGMRFKIRSFDRSLFVSLLTFSAWLFANQLTDLLTMNAPSVVVGAISGAEIIAVWSIAAQLRTLFYSLSTTLSDVFVPKINQIVAESDNNAVLTQLMTKVGRYQAALYCWVLGGFVVLGQWFVRTWAGGAYSDAYWLTLIMTIPLTVPLTQNVGIEIQKAKNMHRARSITYLVCAFTNMVLTAVLAPMLGYWAPAIGFSVYIIVATWIFMNWYYQARVGLDMRIYWKRVAPVLLACAVATVLCRIGTSIMPVSNFIAFFGWGIAYSAIYIVCVGGIALDHSERKRAAVKLAVIRNRIAHRRG